MFFTSLFFSFLTVQSFAVPTPQRICAPPLVLRCLDNSYTFRDVFARCEFRPICPKPAKCESQSDCPSDDQFCYTTFAACVLKPRLCLEDRHCQVSNPAEECRLTKPRLGLCVHKDVPNDSERDADLVEKFLQSQNGNDSELKQTDMNQIDLNENEMNSGLELDLDICQLPKKVGPCRAAFPRFFFNKETRQCEPFIFGGCEGNANNFQTETECERRCEPKVDICLLPKKVGPCRAAIPRFFFNKVTGQCESFLWGGCAPNGNNFETEEQCERACERNPTTEQSDVNQIELNENDVNSGLELNFDFCSLPKKIGPCKGAFPRFFFNKETRQCEKFIFGGCGANLNNFKTLKFCEKACERSQTTDDMKSNDMKSLNVFVGLCGIALFGFGAITFYSLRRNKSTQNEEQNYEQI